eukprot:163246_1
MIAWHLFEDLTTKQITETCLMQIITLFQFILLLTSIIQFHKFNKKSNRESMSPAIQIWYFLVLTLGMFALIVGEWYSISGYFGIEFIKNDIYCEIGVIAANVALINYFAAVFIFYLYRIYITFKDSQFAVTKRTFRIIQMISIFVYISSIFGIVYFHIIDHGVSDHNLHIFCNGSWIVPESIYLKLAFQVIIVISNIFYGFFFYDQLSRFLFFSSNCSGLIRGSKKFELKKLFALIHKQATLVVVSTSSTIVLWSLSNAFYWLKFKSFVQIWVYMDILTNSVCIWLMFTFNQKCYQRYCKICRFCNDKSVFQFSYTETLREISKYPSRDVIPEQREIKTKKKRKNKKNNKNKQCDHEEYDLILEEQYDNSNVATYGSTTKQRSESLSINKSKEKNYVFV